MMKPLRFKEANVEFAKDQPEYHPLPAFLEDSPKGEVITCWGMSFRERLRLLFTGKLWVATLSFNEPLTPMFITTSKGDVLETGSPNPPAPPLKIVDE